MDRINKTKSGQTEKISTKFFLIFIKIFLVYIFLEYFLAGLSTNEAYQLFVKFVGDFMLLIFIIYTIIKMPKFRIYRKQKISFIFFFLILAAVSTLKNQIGIINLLLGIRSLFRYYLIYFFSFYYNIGMREFSSISRFLVRSFYVEIALFFISYFALGTTDVLSHSYLVQALYLNAVFSIILFKNKFRASNIITIALIVVQAFLSTSRLALLGLALQSFIFIFIIWKKNFALKAAVTAGIAVVLLALLASPLQDKIINSEQVAKLEQLTMDAESESNFRLYLLYHFTDLSIKNTNLVGDGPNTFGSLYTREYNPDYYYQYDFTEQTIPYAADSDYTNLLMQYGFIGLAMFYVLMLLFYFQTPHEFKPLILLYFSFIFMASFAIPVFSMRFSSFWIFTLLALTQIPFTAKKVKQNENTDSE